jgi:hypothetical protein
MRRLLSESKIRGWLYTTTAVIGLFVVGNAASLAEDAVASTPASPKTSAQAKQQVAAREPTEPDSSLADQRNRIEYLLEHVPGSLEAPEKLRSYLEQTYRRAQNPKISLKELETILRALDSAFKSNVTNTVNASAKVHGEYFIKIYDEIYRPRFGGKPQESKSMGAQEPDSGKKAEAVTMPRSVYIDLPSIKDEFDQLTNPQEAPPANPAVPSNRPAGPQPAAPPPAPNPNGNPVTKPSAGAANIKIDPALTRTGGNAPQKLVGNVFHNTVIPAGSAPSGSSPPSPNVSSLGSDSVRPGGASFVMPPETNAPGTARPVDRTGASAPGPHVASLPAPTVNAPKPRTDAANYQKAVMDRLKATDARTFGDPKSDGARYASIIILDAYKSHEPPDAAAEHIKKVVDDFLKKRKEAADARKKATRPVVRRPTVTPAEPEVAGDSSPDYSEAASALLGIAGAVAPMVGRVRVTQPTVRAPAAAVHVPTATVRTPVVRTPSQSTITGGSH